MAGYENKKKQQKLLTNPVASFKQNRSFAYVALSRNSLPFDFLNLAFIYLTSCRSSLLITFRLCSQICKIFNLRYYLAATTTEMLVSTIRSIKFNLTM
jgi:hypothetical protein